MYQLLEHQGILNEFNIDYKFKAFTEVQDIDLDMDLEKAEEPEIKLPTFMDHRKSKSSRKTSTSALLTMPKPLTVWITTNWKILKEIGKSDHLTCLLRNLYAGQGTTVRTGHGAMDWF